MLDKLKYVNSAGEQIFFGESDIVINTNDFRNYEWTITEVSNKISKFTRSISKKNLPVLIYGPACKATANTIHQICETDIVAETPGKIFAGDYYLEGYFYGSEKTEYTANGVLKMNLKFTTTSSVWISEKTKHCRMDGSGDEFLDYPYDYFYDYYAKGMSILKNESVTPCDFVLCIYGNNNNTINVNIGGNNYIVFEALAEGEKIIIDSKKRTIIKYDANNAATNIFSKRDKSNYIFNKIRPGTNLVKWNTSFDFDVLLYQERSEPLWT